MPFLTMLDGNVLRICCRELRDTAANAPWLDERTRIVRAGSWHAAYPRARAANFSAAPATDAHGQSNRYGAIPDDEAVRVCDGDLALAAGCFIVDLLGQAAITDVGLKSLRAVRKLRVGMPGRRRELLVTDAGLAGVNSGLKELEIHIGTGITGGGGGFAHLQRLESLKLHHTTVASAAYASLRSLTTLTFDGWMGEPPGDAALKALAACAPGRLRVLSLTGSRGGTLTDVGLAASIGLTSLTVSSPHTISSAGLVRVSTLSSFTSPPSSLHPRTPPPSLAQAHLNGTLRELNLTDATDDIILAVAAGLEKLTLLGSQLVTGRSIAACTSLRHFSANSWPNVSKTAIAAIAGSVRTLELSRSPVTDQMLAPLAGSVHLTELDISGLGLPRRHRLFAPHLSDEGLARALGGTRVRKLGLSGCDKLTGSFLGALTSLEDLNVSFCSKITGSALLPLAARLKHCEMKYSGVSAAEFHAFSLAAAAAAAAAARRPPAVAG
jgi:hypothetical protein